MKFIGGSSVVKGESLVSVALKTGKLAGVPVFTKMEIALTNHLRLKVMGLVMSTSSSQYCYRLPLLSR